MENQTVKKNREMDATPSAPTDVDQGLQLGSDEEAVVRASTPSPIPALSDEEGVIALMENLTATERIITTPAERHVMRPSAEVGKRLSGAARKRYKWLIANGEEAGKAREQAMRPLESRQASKRSRSDGSTPKAVEKRAKKTDAPEPVINRAGSQRSYRQVLTGMKLGIIPESFPGTLLTVDQMKATQEAIMDRIVEQKDGATKPKFLGSTFKPGWLVLNCADEATTIWLKGIVHKIKPWEGANLKAVEDADIPRAQILVGYFPGCNETPSDRILSLIQGQNEGVRVEEWKVLGRVNQNNTATLTLSTDHNSAEVLKRNQYMVNFRFGQVQLRVKGGPKRVDVNALAPPKETTSMKPVAVEEAGQGVVVTEVPKGLTKGKPERTTKERSKPAPRPPPKGTMSGTARVEAGPSRGPYTGKPPTRTVSGSGQRREPPNRARPYVPNGGARRGNRPQTERASEARNAPAKRQ